MSALALALLCLWPLQAKTPAAEVLGPRRDVAFVGVSCYDGRGRVQRGVTILVRDGRIQKLGRDLAVPPGYERIEGGWLIPGLVHAALAVKHSRTTRRPIAHPFPIRRRFRRRRAPSSGAVYDPTKKASDDLDPKEERWRDLLRAGVTTAALYRPGTGITGQVSVVRCAGADKQGMILADGRCLVAGAGLGTAAKKVLREGFRKAKALLDARAKAASQAAGGAERGTKTKTAAEGAASGSAQARPSGGRPQSKPAAKGARPRKADPKAAVLAEVLAGRRPLWLRIGRLADFVQALDALEEALRGGRVQLVVVHDFARQSQETLDRVLPRLKELKARVVVAARLGFLPFTRAYHSPIAKLMAGGVPVVLLPGKDPKEVGELWFRLWRLAQAGTPRARLIQALTGAPAELLGLSDRGRITPGASADLCHFTADPFSPAAQLDGVWLEGRRVRLLPREPKR